MSLRLRLNLAIVGLVAVVVVALSAIHIGTVADLLVAEAQSRLDLAANQLESVVNAAAGGHFERLPIMEGEDPEQRFKDFLRNDPELALVLENAVGRSEWVVLALITDTERINLASSLPTLRGQAERAAPLLEEFADKPLLTKLREIFLIENQDYEVRRELGPRDTMETWVTIRLVFSTLMLRDRLQDPIASTAAAALAAVFLSILLAVLVSHLAYRPLRSIAVMIDRIAQGDADLVARDAAKSKAPSEVGAVESKLTLLGEQFRGAQDDAKRLQTNIDQLLDRMEEAVLFFGRDDRLIISSTPAERLLGLGRWELIGRPLHEIFDATTPLGALVQSAVHTRRQVDGQVVEHTPQDGDPIQLQVSLEGVEDFNTHERIATMITLRDADPRRQLASHIDVSTRLAAISRLTSGAAHEIKNPLNAIALHLEVLKSRMDGASGETEASIAVIEREITRLDRVVKSFLDFTRPVEAAMAPIDLARLLSEVAGLVRPDAQNRGVKVVFRTREEGAMIEGDADLLKQALLNVVMNAVEAIKDEGSVTLSLERQGRDWLVRVADTGVGIDPGQHEKIYNLYFTTKRKGSGIGLAMTFRVVQMHGGTIDFSSAPGEGTEFRLGFPARSQPAAHEGIAQSKTPAEVTA